MRQTLCNNSPDILSPALTAAMATLRRVDSPPNDFDAAGRRPARDGPLEPLCPHCGRLYRGGIELVMELAWLVHNRGLTTMIDRASALSSTAGIAVE